jgi:hypothetical protein
VIAIPFGQTSLKERVTVAMYQIAVIPGDGIGQEVIPEGLKALR